MEETTETRPAYGKRPLWQWIIVYAILAVLVYSAVYYLVLRKQNPYSYQPQANTESVITQTSNSVYKMMQKEKLGSVMTDEKGMTLYTYAKDTSGVSNCTGECLKNWPAYIAPSETGSFPANISVIKRSDGTLQYAWKGMPLYYYTKDSDGGDAYGNGIGGVWSVIK